MSDRALQVIAACALALGPVLESQHVVPAGAGAFLAALVTGLAGLFHARPVVIK